MLLRHEAITPKVDSSDSVASTIELPSVLSLVIRFIMLSTNK